MNPVEFAMIRKVLLSLSIFALGVLITLGFQSISRIGGKHFDPDDPKDLRKLRSMVYSLSPAIEALRNHEAGSRLPNSLEEVAKLPTHFLETFPLLHFVRNDDSFSLYYRLSWDASLQYEGDSGTWLFDPGDGSPSMQIDP